MLKEILHHLEFLITQGVSIDLMLPLETVSGL